MESVDNILLAFLNIKCYENPSGDSRGYIYIYIYRERERERERDVEQLLEEFLKLWLWTRKKPELTPSDLPSTCYGLIQSRG